MTRSVIGCTGHRPHRLGGYSPLIYGNMIHLATEILLELKPDELISGMALGWDQACTHAAIALGIPVTAALPFDEYESMWPGTARVSYFKLLKQCKRVHVVTPGGYTDSSLLFVRNCWVVDNSTGMIALFDGKNFGGTYQCLEYADRKNVPYQNHWEDWLELKQ